MSYAEHATADYRLTILKALTEEDDNRLNETLIERVLETFGHTKSRDYLRTQLKKLEDLGAVKLTEPGSVYVAELLRPGLDHVERRSFLEGVLKPSIGG
ncbi:MAG: hypothetical protein K5905_25640 [Roseibium sp.]|uniref:VpaChn25_0724 family phage protein n=1 Tax=Roseibium sp. TaxID=1936156 RepID=UPI002611D875|nr:hypothetical protein [Roseibium sp.]MCV0428852.1 hypothetical protein [Roseibium sp.]